MAMESYAVTVRLKNGGSAVTVTIQALNAMDAQRAAQQAYGGTVVGWSKIG